MIVCKRKHEGETILSVSDQTLLRPQKDIHDCFCAMERGLIRLVRLNGNVLFRVQSLVMEEREREEKKRAQHKSAMALSRKGS